MTYFSLLPLDTIGDKRGPAWLKWRYRDGLDCRWSLKDFGSDIPIGMVASDAPIPQGLQIADWTTKTRRDIGVLLQKSGVESEWVLQADNYREGLQRLAGLTQSYQANDDNPVAWLGREIYFGFTGLKALDLQAFECEQAELKARIIEPLRVRFSVEKPSFNWRGYLQALALLPFGALPATDTFTGTDGTSLTLYSSNWTYNTATSIFHINTNALCPAAAVFEGAAFWNADTPNADHYSQATVVAITSGVYIGISARNGDGTAQTFYDYISDSADGSYLGKYNAGTYTQLGSTGAVFSTSLAIRLEANGTGIRPMRAGATADIGIQTDAALSNQRFGVAGYNTGIGSRIDNWEGGNLSVATKAKPLFQRKNQVWKRSF